MPPKKKKRTEAEEERLEQLGIYEDEDEKESWRDVG